MSRSEKETATRLVLKMMKSTPKLPKNQGMDDSTRGPLRSYLDAPRQEEEALGILRANLSQQCNHGQQVNAFHHKHERSAFFVLNK